MCVRATLLPIHFHYIMFMSVICLVMRKAVKNLKLSTSEYKSPNNIYLIKSTSSAFGAPVKALEMQNERKNTIFFDCVCVCVSIDVVFFFFLWLFHVYFAEFCASVFDFKAFAKKWFSFFAPAVRFSFLPLLRSLAIVRITYFIFIWNLYLVLLSWVCGFFLPSLSSVASALSSSLYCSSFISCLWNLDAVTMETGTTIQKHSLLYLSLWWGGSFFASAQTFSDFSFLHSILTNACVFKCKYICIGLVLPRWKK